METLDLSQQPSSPEIPELLENQDKPVVNQKNKNKIYILLGIISALLLFSGIWYFLLQPKGSDVLRPFGDSPFGFNSKTVMNPLTGEMYTDEEAAGWKGLRPLAVMINNHVDARPHSGLIYADLVYEIVAEGGITRQLAFFLSNTPEKIGPVRSTRHYYLIPVVELGDAMIMHIGWSPLGEHAITEWPVRSLFRGGAEFWRDNPNDVATEHTAYVDGKYLRQKGEDLGWSGNREIDLWEFKDDLKETSSLPTAPEVTIDFWFSGDYTSHFEYDSSTNLYKHSVGYDADGNFIPHIDRESGEQIAVKNVVLQFAVESEIVGDDKGRLDYDLIGSGTAKIMLDGVVFDATWSKVDRDSRTLFYDTNGNEVRFNRGKMWIAVVPDRNIDQVSFSAQKE